jgi:hypothetical protein
LFSYRKKSSGEERVAIGTLRSDLIDHSYSGQPTQRRPDLVTYFDLQREAFRSFLIQNFARWVLNAGNVTDLEPYQVGWVSIHHRSLAINAMVQARMDRF